MWTPRWGPQATTAWWRHAQTVTSTTVPFPPITSPVVATGCVMTPPIRPSSPPATTPLVNEFVTSALAAASAEEPAKATSCTNCMLQEAMRSERIYTLCRSNQQRLESQNLQIEELTQQIRSLQTTLAIFSDKLSHQFAEKQETLCDHPLPPHPPPPPPPPETKEVACQTTAPPFILVNEQALYFDPSQK